MKMLGSGLSGLWRLFFIVSALLLMAGGPQHPGGTMAEMLADPKWIRPLHSCLRGSLRCWPGFCCMAELVCLSGRGVGFASQSLEQYYKLSRWRFIQPQWSITIIWFPGATPVLTTHLWLAILFYPIFGLTVGGFLIAGMRDRVLGSVWIGWLGIGAGGKSVGAAARSVTEC